MKKFITCLFFLLLLGTSIYTCDDPKIHSQIIDSILNLEGDKIFKTKTEYSRYGIRKSLLKHYNTKYNLNYSLKTLNRKKAHNIASILMTEYKIDRIDNCNLKLLIYDLFYNAGPKTGSLILQKSLNKYYENQCVDEDGILGNQTLNYINQVKNLKNFKDVFIEERLNYYSKLKNWNIYKNGWTKRIKSFSEIHDLDCKSIL